MIFLLVVFSLFALQNILGYFIQIRQYQRVIRKWLGKGILGIGQRKGLFVPGELLVLVYNQNENKVITVQSMRGLSVFVRFREKSDFTGLSLEELRRRGLEADRRDMGLWRIIFKYNYNPKKPSRRKGALIQAVESVENYIAKKNLEQIPKPRDTVISAEEIPAPADTGGSSGSSGSSESSGSGLPAESSMDASLFMSAEQSRITSFLSEKENEG